MKKNQQGFTVIELVVVILIAGILLTLVAMTYNGVRAKNRNNRRQTDVNTLQSHLEAYYAQYTRYPTLAEVNSPKWRAQNMKDLDAAAIQDPRWKAGKNCTGAGKTAVLSGTPASNCYSYQVTASDGSPCDNARAVCALYTLTTMLEGGDKYTKSSPN
jgi:general secretion pathway protein G